jgi:hypothetical protein
MLITLRYVKPDKPDTHWTQKNESNCQPERSDLRRALYLHFEVFFRMLTWAVEKKIQGLFVYLTELTGQIKPQTDRAALTINDCV